jgi:hypothetical protein
MAPPEEKEPLKPHPVLAEATGRPAWVAPVGMVPLASAALVAVEAATLVVVAAVVQTSTPEQAVAVAAAASFTAALLHRLSSPDQARALVATLSLSTWVVWASAVARKEALGG